MPSLGSVTEGMLGTQMDIQTLQQGQIKTQDMQIGLIRDKIDLQKQMTMLSLMQGLKPGDSAASSPDQMSGLLTQMANIQLMSGMPDEAAKTAATASRLQENASKIDYRTYKMQTDRLTKFSNILSQTQDSPQGFMLALQTMAAEDPGVGRDPKFQALARMQWRPGLVNMLRNQVLSEKDRAEITYRKQAGDHAEASAVLDKARVDLVRAQTKLAQDRDTALKKVGALPVKAEQLRAITDQATRDYPSADPADIRVRSRPLAEQMVKMMKEQHLTMSEAATRVYEQARSSGTFSGLRTPPTLPGTKPGVAIPLPKDIKSAKENQWYLVGGEPRLLMGGQLYTESELDKIDREDKDVGLDDDSDEEEAQE